VAEEHGCDLILMGYKRDDDPIENSVIAHVLRHQPCDVAILRSGERGDLEIGRILMPIGGRTIHDALKARLVHSIRDAHDVPVTIMIVVEPGADERKRQWARDALRTAAELYRMEDADLVLDEAEDLAEAITKRVRADDLLVLGMREESWFQSFFFGTVVQRVTGQVDCVTLLAKAREPRRERVRRVLASLRGREPGPAAPPDAPGAR
jgi:nucleotide-binding universal stress UspA family protein